MEKKEGCIQTGPYSKTQKLKQYEKEVFFNAFSETDIQNTPKTINV